VTLNKDTKCKGKIIVDNINSYPILKEPQMRSKVKHYGAFGCCGAEGTLSMVVKLPHSGVVRGEVLNVDVKYKNCSYIDINFTIIKLYETFTDECIERNFHQKPLFKKFKFVNSKNHRHHLVHTTLSRPFCLHSHTVFVLIRNFDLPIKSQQKIILSQINLR
jgi:hypothetical protein